MNRNIQDCVQYFTNESKLKYSFDLKFQPINVTLNSLLSK